MSIESDLYAVLAAIAPTSPVTVPDNSAPPYIVYARVGTAANNVLAGSPAVELVRFSIDCHAATYAAARAMAASIKNTLRGWANGGYVQNEIDIYEPDAKLHRVVIDFELWT